MYKLNKKFNKFIYGIGGIPATYLESLSYEEQLLWFSKNLDELINSVNLSMTYKNYQDLIFEFNTLEKDVLNVGQNIYIDTLNCYDLYIAEIKNTSSIYYYSNDDEIKNKLATNGYIQIGYYVFRPIEGYIDLSTYLKRSELNVILNNYVTNESLTITLRNYVTNQNLTSILGSYVTNQNLNTILENYTPTSSLPATYEEKSNKVTSISSTSTNDEYPSAKCVYDIIGNIESLLGGI